MSGLCSAAPREIVQRCVEVQTIGASAEAMMALANSEYCTGQFEPPEPSTTTQRGIIALATIRNGPNITHSLYEHGQAGPAPPTTATRTPFLSITLNSRGILRPKPISQPLHTRCSRALTVAHDLQTQPAHPCIR